MELRAFAMQDAFATSTTTESFTKDGKTVEMPTEIRSLERWGIWGSVGGYFDHTSIGTGALGIDYRIMPHWLAGVYGQINGDNSHNSHTWGQGGLYTAFFEKGWYASVSGLLGPNSYSVFGSTGYAFEPGNWLTGPVYSIQWDRVPSNLGFGRGTLLQNRFGWWLARPIGRFTPQLQAMYQLATQDQFPGEQNAAWIGAGFSYTINDRWSAFGFYNFEGNDRYQANQFDLGLRTQF
jgi:hypothetical protein